MLGLLVWQLVLGCGATIRAHHHNHRPLEDDEPEAAPPPKVEPWVGFGDLGKLTTVGEPLVSSHRLGDEMGTIRVNALASPYLTGSDLPEGAVIVESLSKGIEFPPDTHFVMTKRQVGYFPAGGDWEYLVVNDKGGALGRGQLPKCARCHAEAPHGFLFRVAKKAPPSGSTTPQPADSSQRLRAP